MPPRTVGWTFAATLSGLTACAATIPKAELDRCTIGTADGNDAFAMRQGAACSSIAQRLSADGDARGAMSYASKACTLQDARGCQDYLALARERPSLAPDELSRARAAGEKACAGMVVGAEGTDARPALCSRTAELYLDVEPRSRSDAGRLYARACKLGDEKACSHAKSLGADLDEHPTAAAAKPLPSPPPAPKPIPGVTAPLPSSQPSTCHEARSCVALDVHRPEVTQVSGTLTNHCDRAVSCTWCPAKGDAVDKGKQCHSTTLAPQESKAGRDAGLWYVGYSAIAYDCVDAGDDRGCIGM
ncbi:MAG TPA: hypothetical protein VKU41_30310 [Polyangiaceae bacterium]|nr:hypothetical protein [Polyangiaceae bacterium]